VITPVSITAFYAFLPFSQEQLKDTQAELKQFGADHDMRGLVLLAPEGINGTGIDYLCLISSLRAQGATLAVIREVNNTNLSLRKNIYLCMALIKKDNFELTAQKVTEIGVNHIVPILCEHSEKKKINIERLEKIVVEASEQSGRGDVPMIHEVTTLEKLFNSGILPQEKIILHPEGISFQQYKNNLSQASIAVFVGPEGGFSPKEIEFFNKYNVRVVSLGSQILRAETAAIAISSLLLL
jgi:16S rRNA (uracil1498-N3)-methyltransferase